MRWAGTGEEKRREENISCSQLLRLGSRNVLKVY